METEIRSVPAKSPDRLTKALRIMERSFGIGSVLLMIAYSIRWEQTHRFSPPHHIILALLDLWFLFNAGYAIYLARLSLKARISLYPEEQLDALAIRRLSLRAGSAAGVLTWIAFLNARIWGFISSTQVFLGVWIGLGIAGLIGLIVYNLLTPFTPDDATPALHPRHAYLVYLVLGVIFGLTLLMRSLWPGSVVLTWGIAPLLLLIVPGLSLAIPLLPTTTLWPVRLGYAAPLSLGTQALSLVWLDWLGVRATTPVFFIVAGGIAVVGFVLFLVSHQQHMRVG